MTAQPKPIFQESAPPTKPSTTSCGEVETRVPALERECRTFCRYLAGCNPNEYVLGKYLEYHRAAGTFALLPPFEATLVRFAAHNRWSARVADSYSARFAKCSVLRKKLALLVGILECSPGFFERIDKAYGGPRLLIFARMGLAVAGSVLALLVSLVLVGPLHLLRGRSPATEALDVRKP